MREYRALRQGLLYNGMTQGVNAVLPILIQYLIVRRLDLVDIGSLNVLTAMQSLFALVVASSGLHLLTVTSRHPEREDSVVISNGMVFGVLCALPSVVAFVAAALTSAALTSRIQHFAVIGSVAAAILTAPLGNSYYFQARLLNRQLFVQRIASRLALLFSIIALVDDPDDAVVFGVLSPLTMVLEYLLAYSRVHALVDLREVTISRQKEILIGSIKYLHFNMTYGVLPHYAVVLGAGRIEPHYFAEFSVLVKIVNLVTGFITSSVMVLYPFKTSRGDAGDDSRLDWHALVWTAAVALVAALSLVVFSAPIYTAMLGREVPVMAGDFRLLTLYVPIHSVFNYYMFNVLIHEGRHKFVVFLNSAVIAGFASIVVLNDSRDWGFSLSWILVSTAAAALAAVLAVAQRSGSRQSSGSCSQEGA